MKYSNLEALDRSIQQTGNNGEYKLDKVDVAIPGETLRLKALLCTPKNRSGYYYKVAHPKERIVIHYTAGQVRSDLETLTRQDYHVSVPFVIARDGTIYQLFGSRFWSGHIGKGLGNTNTGNAEDKKTIGIELCNYGFLNQVGNNLETIYSRLKDRTGKAGPVDVYCTSEQMEAYIRLNKPFRNQTCYAAYTNEQYNSLIILLRYLTATYQIPRAFLPENVRLITTPQVLTFKGIVTHINYRIDGKWDIGSAFDWTKVIKGVQVPVYSPLASRSVEESTKGFSDTLSSEEELEELLPKPAASSTENNDYEELTLAERAAAMVDGPAKKKVYALLVGISDYRSDVTLNADGVIFPKLSGCVADVLKIKSYLEKDPTLDADILVLTDQQASKAEIVQHFSKFLGKAGVDDVALFYFSGHGTQELVDKSLFGSETDGKSESIACFFDQDTAGQALLADKELRWLIRKLDSKAHLITMFDCCHSAGVTRNAALVAASFKDVVEKRSLYTFPVRQWTDYIFHKELTQQELKDKGEAVIFPEGSHIQMSACESYESALEVSGEGVFTKTLLKVLEMNKGSITYSSLLSQIRQYLQGVFEQKPRLYYTGTDEYLNSTLFLNKDFESSLSSIAEVVYNSTNGWIINRGAIHGLRPGIDLNVFAADNNSVYFKASLDRVEIDYSSLSVEGLDKDKVYLSDVSVFMAVKLNVFIAESTALLKDQEQIVDAIVEELRDIVVLVDTEREADYVLRFLNESFYLTLPEDPFRPLVKQVEVAVPEDPAAAERYQFPAKQITNNLKHMAAWEFIRQLKNQDQSAPAGDLLKIEYALDGAPYQEHSTDQVEVLFKKENNKWLNTMKIRISNISDSVLYCCAILLPSDFASFTGFLNPSVRTLEKGESVELGLNGATNIQLSLDERMRWYNVPSSSEQFKFLVSTEYFNADTLTLEALPSPIIPGDRNERGVIQYGSSGVNKGWYTRDISLLFINPLHNQISQEDLNTMLEDDRTADFALGLYYTPDETSPLAFKYKLKPEIVLLQSEGYNRSIIIDIANKISRIRRNKRYRQDILRFPKRTRLISEGDSWFQHPLVHDIIDHVSRAYPTYCVAAAGDTLRNIMSNGNQNGDYFLKAIEQENPAVFLLSGGGNDILGSQFRTYLQNNPNESKPEGEMPERFLKPTLLEEVNSLMAIYRTIFQTLRQHYPALRIIVHGYDYPIKLNDPKKGWLGRYMIEKGIRRPGDRKAVIRYIMNEFNARLKAEAENAPNAVYLDLRNLVRYNTDMGVDQWYDEIHPNHDGFQEIAMRYIQKINELVSPNL